MINLKETYDNIQELFQLLHDFDVYTPYQQNVNKLYDSVNDILKYFGIRTLKREIGAFRKDETIKIMQDESGCWITPLDDDTDDRQEDLFEYMIPLEELFL